VKVDVREDDGPAVPRHQTVRSVVKASRLLLCIAESDGLTAVEAAVRVEIPMGTAYHLLNTLLAEGMLTRDPDRRYKLGPKVAALTLAYSKRGPSEHALALVRELAESTGETAYLSGWQDGEVVALAAIEGSSAVRVGRIHTVLRGHEHARASGKVMLANLSERELDAYLGTHGLAALTDTTIVTEARLRAQLQAIHRTGFAFDEAEFTPGVGCVAAPIWEGDACVACLTLSAPLERLILNRVRLRDAVVDAARRASHR
jgi:IclR family transcriptional regulator, acetate operon repressor